MGKLAEAPLFGQKVPSCFPYHPLMTIIDPPQSFFFLFACLLCMTYLAVLSTPGSVLQDQSGRVWGIWVVRGNKPGEKKHPTHCIITLAPTKKLL